MNEVENKKPILITAAAFLKSINEGGAGQKALVKPVLRQAFYKTILPLFATNGHLVTNGRKQSLRIGYEGDDCYGPGSLIAQWQHYARFREAMIANGVWIGRRNWSWEDLLAVQDTPIPTIVTPELE